MRSNFEDRYFSNARKNNERIRGYFDEDDDDQAEPNHRTQPESSAGPASPEDDPLDAFMYVYIKNIDVSIFS
jgi:hypothetical protein